MRELVVIGSIMPIFYLESGESVCIKLPFISRSTNYHLLLQQVYIYLWVAVHQRPLDVHSSVCDHDFQPQHMKQSAVPHVTRDCM